MDVYSRNLQERSNKAWDKLTQTSDGLRELKEGVYKLYDDARQLEVKTTSFETRFDSTTKRTTQYIEESCDEVFKKTEQIIFDSFNQSRREMKDS